jgi:glycine cleavage system H protein
VDNKQNSQAKFKGRETMTERKYTDDHEWITMDGDVGTVGITDFAQEQLGDIVFIEVPDVGKELLKGNDVAVVESVKAASELYSPVNGEVVASNDALGDAPEIVNSDPFGEGWFFKIRLSDPAQLDDLMDEAAYKAHTGA